MLKENLEEVEEKIAKACERAGRAREEVTSDRGQQDKTGRDVTGDLR